VNSQPVTEVTTNIQQTRNGFDILVSQAEAWIFDNVVPNPNDKKCDFLRVFLRRYKILVLNFKKDLDFQRLKQSTHC